MTESDWKLFRKLQPALLNRLCEQILRESAQVIGDDTRSAHERFLALFRLINERNEHVALCFNDPRRSNLMLKLNALFHLDLLEDQEQTRFSAEVRELFEFWRKRRDERD